jgi:phospholipid/cholesterol/gamma-HCH transport system substrate-binding protein
MSKSRLEWRVGAFVILGLILTAAMIMRFSKGTGLSTTYRLNLEAANAGGIIPGAAVLMAGVPIGGISEIRLAGDGSKVTMVASIYSRFNISSNAVFGIATVGFLGDRYISVSPGPIQPGKHPGFRKNGDTVQVEEAFDLTAVAQSANGLMMNVSGIVIQFSNVVSRLDTELLTEQTLHNLSETVTHLRKVSERALVGVNNINSIIETNGPSLSGSLTNFRAFVEKLNKAATDLQETLATNKVEFTSAVKNIGRATDRADRILQEVEQGKGLAGNLLRNEEMAQNTALILSNFMVFSSNLNQKGLWGVIRKPKPPKEER